MGETCYTNDNDSKKKDKQHTEIMKDSKVVH